MAKKWHGTPGAYNEGCRCKACRDCTASRAWAERKVKEWDTPLRVEVDDSFPTGGGMIPAQVIMRAIAAREKEIKKSALAIIWKETKRSGRAITLNLQEYDEKWGAN